MLFDDVFQARTLERVVEFLKTDCKLDVGFCSQAAGKAKPSATSTAIVIYALQILKQLDEVEAGRYTDELLSFRVKHGHYKGAFGVTDGATTWSTSQACLALEALGNREEGLRDAILWLCTVQGPDGGWSFNGRRDQPTSIEYCLYPLLALNNYFGKEWCIRKALERGLAYVRAYRPTSTFARLVKLYLLRRIFHRTVDIPAQHDALTSLRRDVLRGSPGDTIVDSGQAHFYINFYLPSYYLLFRSFTRPDNPLSIYLIRQLRDSIIDSKGWAPPNRPLPYSWTTALGMLTVFLWTFDCRKYGVEDGEVIESLKLIKRGDIPVRTYVERCPLTGGLCNKTAEINRQYSDQKIFLNIPYSPEYLTFERELTKTIKRSKLIPVVAKDSVRSRALLCKICSLIQESRFGLADVSYPTHNIPFELGLMLGLSKSCVILKRKDALIPSDISGLEYVEYQNTVELSAKLGQWIRDNK